MRDKITLGDDPFSSEYFGRFADLTASIGPLLEGDTEPYKAYLQRRRQRATSPTPADCEETYCENQAQCVKKLAEIIRDDGYDPQAWKTCGRELDYDKGQGPITITIGADGTINSFDGLHRSAILQYLDEPVVAEVYRRHARWVELKEFHKTLYQPYPHPDFAGHKVTRKGTERFSAIADWINGHCVDEMKMKIMFVGACTGFGLNAFRNMGFNCGGIEPSPERFALCKSLLERGGRLFTPLRQLTVADCGDIGHNDYIIGLSVYHHVATSVEQWRTVAKKLAACPVHIIELPGDHEKQWHAKFREETGGLPRQAIIDILCEAGDFEHTSDVIYTDHTYANRVTFALVRKQ